jgi:RNA polymerase sigma-70 factor (ECF subfamily)
LVDTKSRTTQENAHDPAGKTLGDFLCATQRKDRVPESDWVRLVQFVAGGDQLALHELYERTHRLVFTQAMRVLRSRESAEEVTVDVFHDVWRRAARYDPAGGTVIGWIMNQARSRAIDRLRFEQRKKRVNPYSESSAHEAAGSPEEIASPEERQRALRDALEVLTPHEREAIESAFLCELTYAQVAVRLKQPLGTIKTRIRSALAKLRVAFAVGDS